MCGSILAYSFRRALAPIVGKATFRLQELMDGSGRRSGIALPDDDDLEAQHHHDRFDVNSDDEIDTTDAQQLSYSDTVPFTDERTGDNDEAEEVEISTETATETTK